MKDKPHSLTQALPQIASGCIIALSDRLLRRHLHQLDPNRRPLKVPEPDPSRVHAYGWA